MKMFERIIGYIITGILLYLFVSKTWGTHVLDGTQSKLESSFRRGDYKTTISIANASLMGDTTNTYADCCIRHYRGMAYLKLGDYQNALNDIQFVIRFNGKGAYDLHFIRAKLYDELQIRDTASICFDVTQAIHGKGSIVHSRNQKFDYIDTTELMDFPYFDMLKLRVKYCDKLMPELVDVDKELILKGH
jgi:tetratricopeptide (TPR) repeat protein